MAQIVQSAGYFTVKLTNHWYGVITLSSGRSERRVLCRNHAYLQLQGLETSGQVDKFEAMHLRVQIEDSPLPLVVPSEYEGEIQGLITQGEDAVRSIFAGDYFHPTVEEFLADDGVVDVSSRTVPPAPPIQQLQ